jgi:putative transcriptional regulator
MELEEKIAGEIALSQKPGETLKKWRETFGLNESELAQALGVSPSVINDWEKGRRVPSTQNIKKIVRTLMEIDSKRGGEILKRYTSVASSDAIYAMNEFSVPVKAKRFAEVIDGKPIGYAEGMDRDIYGYTVMDSLKTITSFGALDYLRIFGWSTQRALVFCGVKFGRSPMIAVRAQPVKPAMVVFHQPDRVDELAVKLAEIEKIPLVTTELSMKKMLEALAGLK